MSELLTWGIIIALFIAAFAVLQLEKYWHRTAEVFFTFATLLTLGRITLWAWENPDGLRGGATFVVAIAAIAANVWFVKKVEANIHPERAAKGHSNGIDRPTTPHSRNDAAEEIRRFYNLLTPEEKRVLRYILPLHRSPTNLNVGQLKALEGVQQKTGFVGRNHTTGSYELNPQVVQGLKILLPLDAGLYGKIICCDLVPVLQAKDRYYDCFLIFQVKVQNDGPPTTVSRFQLDVYWAGVEYPSIKQTVAGYYVKYPLSHADDPQMQFERRPLAEFPYNEEISNVNFKVGWVRYKVGTFPTEAIGDFQRFHKEVVLRLLAFDSQDKPHVIYERSSEELSGCGRIERARKVSSVPTSRNSRGKQESLGRE